MVSKGQIVGIDWNRIARLHSHVLAHMNSLTASRCHINAYEPARSRTITLYEIFVFIFILVQFSIFCGRF